MQDSNCDSEQVIIDINNLVASYGQRKVLDGINMKVRQGEIMVVMGGSGSGKSTLMRCLLGLKQPVSGTIDLLGKQPKPGRADDWFEIRKQIGVAFQGGALFGSMSVGENIKLPLREHSQLDESTMQVMTRIKLEMVNLAGFEDMMPAELSGGMLKRAALARAIILDPKLLFFDEPSAGLDPVTSAELDELILQLRNALNTTVVVVTHELESALKIADRVTVLGDSKVLMTGTVEEVQNSHDQQIQDLLNRKPRDVTEDVNLYLQRLTQQRRLQ